MQQLTAPWQHLNVGTLSTTRLGGVSNPPYHSLNLALHVGDNPEHVLQNRALVNQSLPKPAVWLEQVHSADVISVEQNFDYTKVYQGDALYTQQPQQPLAIMTADCLPILLASASGHEVAAIHGGWRGLEQGIIANTVAHFSAATESIYAWLGPAIGAEKFEVGEQVFRLFEQQNPAFSAAFTARAVTGKYLADIYKIAEIQLNLLGISHISGGSHCTVSQSELFFSYRKQGTTGRMASMIWRK